MESATQLSFPRNHSAGIGITLPLFSDPAPRVSLHLCYRHAARSDDAALPTGIEMRADGGIDVKKCTAVYFLNTLNNDRCESETIYPPASATTGETPP